MFAKLQAMKNSKKKGFTLMELIVVMAILGILMAIAVPKYNSLKEESAQQVGISNARTVYTAGMAADAMGKTLPDMLKAADVGGAERIGWDSGTTKATWRGTVGSYTVEATYNGTTGTASATKK